MCVSIASLGSPVVPEVTPNINIESYFGSSLTIYSFILYPSFTKSEKRKTYKPSWDAIVISVWSTLSNKIKFLSFGINFYDFKSKITPIVLFVTETVFISVSFSNFIILFSFRN